jgi:hypothetical protein
MSAIGEIFALDNQILNNTNFTLPINTRQNSSVACTQRNKENIRKEIERNTRRKTIDKILRLSQLCNLDPFQENTIIILILLNLKCVVKENLLRAFIQARSEVSTPVKTDDSTSNLNVEPSSESDEANVNAAENSNEVNAAAQDQNFISTQLQLFDTEILKHLDTVLPDVMNTITDWLSLLEYVNVESDCSDIQMVSVFDACMQSAQLQTSCIPAYALLHAYIDNIPSALMLERLFLRSFKDADTAYGMSMEMRTLRLLSAFHDHIFTPENEMNDLCNILLNIRVNPVLFQHMTAYMQESYDEQNAENNTRKQFARIRLRESKPKHNHNIVKNNTDNFQAWTAQQRFSTISSKHLQLILYFVTVQSEEIPHHFFAQHYSPVICERIKNARTPNSQIDEEALLILIKSIRTYSYKIPNLVTFVSNCLQSLTQRSRQNLSKVEILQLYIIAYQHESIVQRLWQNFLSEYGHTIQENLKSFRKKYPCDYQGVLNNMLMVHKQNADFKRRAEQLQ